MNAWINQITELAGFGRGAIYFSISDMSQMPDLRLLWTAGIAAVLMLVAFWKDRRLNRRDDRKSDTHQK